MCCPVATYIMYRHSKFVFDTINIEMGLDIESILYFCYRICFFLEEILGSWNIYFHKLTTNGYGF